MRRAAPRREPAPYFVGPRCAFVCVCVCLCVYSRVGAFRCLVCRPFHLCVCRVGTPPARKYAYLFSWRTWEYMSFHPTSYIYAPEGGVPTRPTHTSGTAYTRGTYSRVHTQTHNGMRPGQGSQPAGCEGGGIQGPADARSHAQHGQLLRRWQLRPLAVVHGRGRGGTALASRHAGPHALRAAARPAACSDV